MFGLCGFLADNIVAKSICAISYGIASEHPVLPASLFCRSVFVTCGMFDEYLRAAEDRKWMSIVASVYGPKTVCIKAKVHYAGFPTSIYSVARKYFLYQRHVIKAGLGGLSQTVYVCATCCWIGSFFICPEAAGLALALYIVLRGIVDPIRRSKQKKWWGNEPLSILMAPIVALVVDISKTIGILHTYLSRKHLL